MKRIVLQTFLALCLAQVAAYAQTTSWKGTTSTDWSKPANWTAGVPTAFVDAIIGDASFTGNNQPSLSANSVCKSLIIGAGTKSSTLKVGKALTVNGDVTIGSKGTINHSAATIIGVKGNWSNGGKYTAGNNKSTVAFSGTAQSISGATNIFRQLTINAGSATTLAGNITVNNLLTVSGTVDPGEAPSFKVSGSGKTVVNAGGTIKVKAPTFSGNYATTGAITLNAASTVDYAAVAVNQSVDNRFTYGTLRISGGLTKTLAGSLPALNSTLAASGNLVVAGGILHLPNNFTANRGTTVPGGTITVADGATLRIGGTASFPLNYQTHLLAPTSTVEYSGTSQNVSLELYGNLALSSSSGAAVKTMPNAAMTVAGNLTSFIATGTSVSFTAGGAVTIGGSVTLGPFTTFDGSNFAHSVARNWTNDGTFNSTGSVTLSGTGAVIGGGGVNNFNDLTLSGANITASGTSLNVAGNFATVGSGTFKHLGGTMTGTVTMSGSGKTISGTGITFNNLIIFGSINTANSLTVAGNLTVTGGLSATAGTITLSGVGSTISGTGAIAFNALNVPGSVFTANSFSVNSSLSVSGSLNASAGTVSFVGSSTFSGAANLFDVRLNGTKLQLGAASVLGVAKAFIITAGTFDTTSTVPNTVNYNSPTIQFVAPAVYYNLTLSANGTKTAGGDLTVNGDLTIGSGTTFDLSTHTLSLSGNWKNQGAFTAGASTVVLLGGNDTSLSGSTVFNTLTVNKGASANVTLNNNATASILNMTGGRMLTGPNSITITSDRTGNGIILGTITHTHSFATGTPYAFEGPNNTVNFSALTSVSSVTVTVTKSPVLDFQFHGSINRQYNISLAASGPYAATLRLHYEDVELNGNSESDIQLWHFFGPWAPVGKSANDTANNWVEKDALTDISGGWSLSDNVSAARWVGGISGAWEDPGNWLAVQGNPNLPPSTNDVAYLATDIFRNNPTITSAVTVKQVQFGSGPALTLSLGQGGSLTTRGNIDGAWTNDAAHTILVGDQTLTVGGVLSLSDGTNNHTISLLIGSGSVKVADDLTQSGGTIVAMTGTGNLNIGGDFIHQSGTFSAGSGTVTYNGSEAQAVAGGISYNNLTFDKTAGTATLTNSAAVNGSLVLSNSGVFLVKSDLVISNDVTVQSNATLTVESSTLSVGGDWNRLGTFTAGSGTVRFDGDGPQVISPTTFNHLTIDKSADTATLTGNLTIDGDLNLAAGNLDLGGFSADRNVEGGRLTLGDGTQLTVGGHFPANFAAENLAASSIVEYNGAGAQSVEDAIYGSLYLSNGGDQAKTLIGPTTVKGDLQINGGATLDSGSFALDAQGDWINGGVFVPANGSVTLSGSANSLSGPTTFNNLTVSGNYSAFSDVTVDGAMTVSGVYQAGGTVLTLAGNLVNNGTLASSGTITFTGAGPQAIALNAGFSSSGTVNFNGTVSPSLIGTASPTFQRVNINNTSAIAPAIGWVVNGLFTVGPGATFIGGASTHTFKGDFANNGLVASASGGSLVFSPSGPATLALGDGSFVSSGVVIFGGTGQLTLTGGTPSLNSVIIANTHPAGVTPSANWVLAGDLVIGDGATLQGSGLTFTVAGDWSNNGVFNGQNSTVTLTGAADTVNGTQIAGSGTTTFNHLVIGGLIVANGDFDVAGNFTHNGDFDGSAASVTFTGGNPSIVGGSVSPILFSSLTIAKSAASVTLAADLTGITDLTVESGTLDAAARVISQDIAGGDLTILAGATLKIGGSNTLPVFTNYILDPASTVEYSGTGAQTIAVQNYGNLTSSSSGARVLPSGATIGVAGAFSPGVNSYTITGSTIDYNGSGPQTIAPFNYYNLSNSSGGARVLGTNSVIGVANTFSPGAGVYTVTGSTINFNGAAQTVPAFTYYNLSISGSGTKTLGGNITADGSLSLNAGTLADVGFTATVKGDADNEAAHTGAGKILLAGGSAQHLLSGGGAYGNLELNDSLGARLSQTNLTVNGTLTFTDGNILTTTNKVIVGPLGAVARSSGHVVGNLQKNVPLGANVTNRFEIGDLAAYAPVTLILTNVTIAGNVTASTTPGNHPDIANSGVSATRGANRYWTMTNSATRFVSYSALLNFAAGDVDYAANPTNFIVGKKDGAAWTLPTIASRTTTNILAIGMTNFSDYVVGEPLPPAPVITSQPQSQTVSVGGTAQFSVDVDPSVTGTLTYQWFHDGQPISGATNSTLTITNVQPGDAGTYTVVVDNGSPVTSSSAVLTVAAPPTTQGIQIVGGNAQINFAGVPGGTYWIQAATNLNTPIFWSVVATNVADSNGLFQYVDGQVKDFPARFFRAVAP